MKRTWHGWSFNSERCFVSCGELFPCSYYNIFSKFWRSGTVKAANGEAVLSIVVVGRIDVGGAVEVEVVGVAGARVWSR